MCSPREFHLVSPLSRGVRKVGREKNVVVVVVLVGEEVMMMEEVLMRH